MLLRLPSRWFPSFKIFASRDERSRLEDADRPWLYSVTAEVAVLNARKSMLRGRGKEFESPLACHSFDHWRIFLSSDNLNHLRLISAVVPQIAVATLVSESCFSMLATS